MQRNKQKQFSPTHSLTLPPTALLFGGQQEQNEASLILRSIALLFGAEQEQNDARWCAKGLDILSPLIHVKDLQKHGITLYFTIEKEIQRILDVPAI